MRERRITGKLFLVTLVAFCLLFGYSASMVAGGVSPLGKHDLVTVGIMAADDSGVSTASIPEEEVPLASFATKSWSAVSLISMVAALVVCVWAVRKLPTKRHVPFKALSILLGAFIVLLFFFSNSMGGRMEVVNYTTLPLVLLTFVQTIVMLASLRRIEEPIEEET